MRNNGMVRHKKGSGKAGVAPQLHKKTMLNRAGYVKLANRQANYLTLPLPYSRYALNGKSCSSKSS
jgi:hypothetical protein